MLEWVKPSLPGLQKNISTWGVLISREDSELKVRFFYGFPRLAHATPLRRLVRVKLARTMNYAFFRLQRAFGRSAVLTTRSWLLYGIPHKSLGLL